MATMTIKTFSDLKKRVGRFLGSKLLAGEEVQTFLNKIEPLGNVAIFGGMLRDFSLQGIDGFKSDIDLVIHTNVQDELEFVLAEYDVSKNKFGGYRLKLGKWDIDLWVFDSTWAFRQSLVEGRQLKDLCKTTFFNWDAIIYEISSGTVYAIEGYIDKLNERILDINLEKNPFPTRNVVKTFKYCELYNAILSPRLVQYVYQNLKRGRNRELNSYVKSANEYPIFDEDRVISIF